MQFIPAKRYRPPEGGGRIRRIILYGEPGGVREVERGRKRIPVPTRTGKRLPERAAPGQPGDKTTTPLSPAAAIMVAVRFLNQGVRGNRTVEIVGLLCF